MPVGKVFDASQNQVLFNPVSNFYKGKAIRAGLAAQEQDAELKGLQIEAAKTEVAQAPERWAMAKKQAESQQEAFDLSLEQAKRDGRWTDLQRSAQVLIPWVQEIGEIAGQDGANSIEAMARANETSAKMIEQLSGVVSDDQLESLQKLAGEDHKWQPEEFLSLGKYLQSFMAKEEQLKMAAPNPKDFTPDSWARYANTGDSSELRALPKAPLVTINQDGENEATRSYAKTVGGRAGDRDDKAAATFESDAALTRLELAIARGARTGFGESVILDIRGALETFGVVDFPEGAEQTEVARSIGNILALRLRNPSSGLGLTGNTSNKDLQFLKDSVAGISRSEGGNLALIKMTKRMNQFKRDIAAKQSDIIAENDGSIPMNIDRQLMEYANNYEIFTKREREEINRLLDGQDGTVSIEDASDQSVLDVLGLGDNG